MDQNFVDTDSGSASKKGQCWLFMGIGFILGALIFFAVGQNYTKPTAIKDPLAGARYGIAGKVFLVEENVLTVGVDAGAFGLPPSAYKVYIDGKTVFKKTVYNKTGASGLNIFESKPIAVTPAALADVALGDQVVAKSKANFGNLKEFIASEVEIRIYQ